MTDIHSGLLNPWSKSPAERRLHEAFARELGNDWRVFHQVAWIGKDGLGRPYDGETDFVVAHPNLGVLVIEVKGGRIRFDGRTGHYISTDRSDVEHDIGDPFDKVTGDKHTLIAKVRSLSGWPQRRVVFGHMVAFPDAVVEAGWLRPNAPREIIIDALNLVSLEARLRGALAFWQGEHPTDSPPGRDGIETLTRLLSTAPHIRNPLMSEQARLDECHCSDDNVPGMFTQYVPVIVGQCVPGMFTQSVPGWWHNSCQSGILPVTFADTGRVYARQEKENLGHP